MLSIRKPGSSSVLIICDLFNSHALFYMLFYRLTDRKHCSNKFTWCFHKQNYYMFYRHANIQRTYFWSVLVESWRSFGQIKSKGAVHIMFFSKKAANCELAVPVPVPNLLAMCELAIFYTLYQRSVISLAGQSLTLAI